MIDHALLRQLADDVSLDDLRIIIDAFDTDMDRLCAVLRDAAQAGDSARCHRTAHAIAGSAGAVAARGLEQIARAAMTGSPPPGTSLVDQAGAIAAAAAAAQAALAAFLRDGAQPA